MRNLMKTSLSCLVLLLIFLSPMTYSTKLYAGAVLTKEKTEEPKLNEPKLNATELSIVTGSDFTLRVYNMTENQKVRFKSDDSSIVSVSKTGKLTANKVGETVITVTLKGGVPKEDTVFKCKVTVGPPAISIKLTLRELTLEVGKKKTLQAILKPNTTAETGVFTSLNSDIAEVSATGRVEAKKVGKTYIISAIQDGTYDFCEVNVVEATAPSLPPLIPTGPSITE